MSVQRAQASAVDRRTFFSRLFWGLSAVIGALIGLPVIGAFLSPAFKPIEKADWVAVGPAGSFGPTPTLAHHMHPANEGWVNQTAEMQVWVVRDAQGGYRVFDNHCTHLGCPYHWDETQQKFLCPCHGGQFDATGRVLAGPPPRPLDHYETKVENGTLYMGALVRGGA
ncbi:MAG TPA: ubiquinol-cytochrome c reductase iron-sulfur subunit [bacterium]|nr:ubiquinol-cytochrome c reductase iron-sulfur subunit [bacterium]